MIHKSRETLSAAIDTLPDPLRQLLRMQMLSHLSADEIATKVKLPLAEVEDMLYEGGQKLRVILGRKPSRTILKGHGLH